MNRISWEIHSCVCCGWRVNVEGTRHIADLCERYQISRLVCVSSVHAIEEAENGQVIRETKQFSASRVKGIYGKSKAEAAAYVLKAAERGLDAVIVHPSGIIGPEDYSGGYMTETIRAYLNRRIPLAVEGGYGIVDSERECLIYLGREKMGTEKEAVRTVTILLTRLWGSGDSNV